MNKAEKQRELEARKQRGVDAEKVLSHPLVDTALRHMEEEIVRKMKAISSSDVEARDTLWRDLQAAAKFREKFTNYVRNGREAQTILQRLLKGTT